MWDTTYMVCWPHPLLGHMRTGWWGPGDASYEAQVWACWRSPQGIQWKPLLFVEFCTQLLWPAAHFHATSWPRLISHADTLSILREWERSGPLGQSPVWLGKLGSNLPLTFPSGRNHRVRRRLLALSCATLGKGWHRQSKCSFYYLHAPIPTFIFSNKVWYLSSGLLAFHSHILIHERLSQISVSVEEWGSKTPMLPYCWHNTHTLFLFCTLFALHRDGLAHRFSDLYMIICHSLHSEVIMKRAIASRWTLILGSVVDCLESQKHSQHLPCLSGYSVCCINSCPISPNYSDILAQMKSEQLPLCLHLHLSVLSPLFFYIFT